jgi:hypothetical protein
MNTQPIHSNVGLCQDCQYARQIESDRGSVFLRCELSFQDPRFAKFPRLPVLDCDGYQQQEISK